MRSCEVKAFDYIMTHTDIDTDTHTHAHPATMNAYTHTHHIIHRTPYTDWTDEK